MIRREVPPQSMIWSGLGLVRVRVRVRVRVSRRTLNLTLTPTLIPDRGGGAVGRADGEQLAAQVEVLRGDVGEMWGRYGRDMGEIWARWARLREIWWEIS